MLAVLDDVQINMMWPKMREIYDVTDGWNVANTLLDENTAIIEFIREKTFQSLIGKNYRINVFKDYANFVFMENITRDYFKELSYKVTELGIEFIVRKFPNRSEPPKLVIDLGEDYLERALALFELLKIK